MVPVDEDGFEGYRNWPLDLLLGVTDIPNITLRWKGSRIPIAVWHRLCAFFEAQYALTKGEAQARFYYNPKTQEWKVWVFPQEWSSTMSTKELEDHPERAGQSLALGADFMCWGTVHHHCTGSAFQSGTDTADEQQQNGIHITIGHMGSKLYDLDGRVYFAGIKYVCIWAHWFEYDPAPPWVNRLPPEEQKMARNWFAEKFNDIERVLKEPPPKDTPFPEVWISNLVKQVFHGNGGGHGGHNFQGSQQSQGTYPRAHGFSSGCANDPKPYQFLTDIDRLVTASSLHESVIQVLLDDVCANGIITGNGKTVGEAEFLNLFSKCCMDHDMFPRSCAGRMARQKIYPSIPTTESEIRIVEATCMHGGDANLSFAEMISPMGNLYGNPHATGWSEAERSLIQNIRQLAAHYKIGTMEVARLFFDYVDPRYYAEVNIPREEARLQQELLEEHRARVGYEGGIDHTGAMD